MISPPEPTKQLSVHQMLLAFRRTMLHEALRETLSNLDPRVVAAELADLALDDARRALAAAGIRDEYVLAAPCVLDANPRLLGYYRLMLGSPQKQFYGPATGLGPFRRMELDGLIRSPVAGRLPELCRALNDRLGSLIQQISPGITMQDVNELPLLVLGVQMDGVLRNRIGATATVGVFEAIKNVIDACGCELTLDQPNELAFDNAAGRQVVIRLAADPDLVIEEKVGSSVLLKVAIEIKGGTDRSNAHNRAGEAEKSHQKVRDRAADFWTVISLRGLDLDMLRRESPTTRHWFDVSEVLAGTGATWEFFFDQLVVACGIGLE